MVDLVIKTAAQAASVAHELENLGTERRAHFRYQFENGYEASIVRGPYS